MTYNYSFQEIKKEHARAVGLGLPISTKKAVEVCNFIRKKKLALAIEQLQKVTEKKLAIPYKRYAKGGTGHKKGIGPGRYPVKTCNEIIKLLRAIEANAQQKGLNTKELVIVHMAPQKAAKSQHYGRKRRREMKRTNLEVIVEETKEKKAGDKK